MSKVDPEELLRAAFQRHVDSAQVASAATTLEWPPNVRRPRRRLARLFVLASAAVVSAVAVGVAVIAARTSSPGAVAGSSMSAHPSPLAAKPIASAVSGDLRIDVLSSEAVQTIVDQGTCFAVSLQISNVGAQPQTVTGKTLEFMDLVDEGGPVVVAPGKPDEEHLADREYFSCQPNLPSGPGLDPGAHQTVFPPATLVAPGASWGPFTLHFIVAGPTGQHLALRSLLPNATLPLP
jgi:hypothetical protein